MLATRCSYVTSHYLLAAERSTRRGVARVGDSDWTSSEKAKYGDVADIIISQQRFIATMQGRTATFSTFSVMRRSRSPSTFSR